MQNTENPLATVKQVNAGVDALKAYLLREIDAKVPGMFQNTARNAITNELLLEAVETILSATEKVKE